MSGQMRPRRVRQDSDDSSATSWGIISNNLFTDVLGTRLDVILALFHNIDNMNLTLLFHHSRRRDSAHRLLVAISIFLTPLAYTLNLWSLAQNHTRSNTLPTCSVVHLSCRGKNLAWVVFHVLKCARQRHNLSHCASTGPLSTSSIDETMTCVDSHLDVAPRYVMSIVDHLASSRA